MQTEPCPKPSATTKWTRTSWLLFLTATLGFWTDWLLRASDHADAPLAASLSRHDARITDLYAFTRGPNLVLILCTDPAIPPAAAGYVYPSDLILRFYIDNHSPVRFDQPADLQTYGGTLERPGNVAPDIIFEITFDSEGQAAMKAWGLSSQAHKRMSFFAGLRDDPFIRGPRQGRNVAAVVVEIPLEDVLAKQPTLLLWAMSKVPHMQVSIADHAGRSLRSMFPENFGLNDYAPRDHFRVLGQVPDVVIFDTSASAAYPNGRALADDVVDLVGDERVLMNDFPFPTENDLPFLEEFPYLAPPHAPR